MFQVAAGSQLSRPPHHGTRDRGPAQQRRVAEGWTIDPAYFIWAVVRGICTGTEALHFVSPVPKQEPREEEMQDMLGRAAVELARPTGQ